MDTEIRNRRCALLAAVTLACGSVAVSASAAILAMPTLTELQLSIRNTSIQLNDPELGLGKSFQDLSEEQVRARKMQIPSQRRGLVAEVALYNLMAGNVAQFNERLNEYVAANDHDIESTLWAENVSSDLHLATEAGVTVADIDIFRRAVDAMEANQGNPAALASYAPMRFRLYSASYFYLSAKTAQLETLAVLPRGTVNASIEGLDALFVAGYANVLLAKLTNSPKAAQTAIDYLQRGMDVSTTFVEYPGDFGQGRMSLQMADAYRLLAMWTKDTNQRRHYVDQAVKAARVARQKIELLDYPLLWGAAHRVTSEVLDIMYKDEDDAGRRDSLSLLRDRAYELSLSYE